MKDIKVICVQCGEEEDPYYCVKNCDSTWICENCITAKNQVEVNKKESNWYHSCREIK